jgi:hypothetical protein
MMQSLGIVVYFIGAFTLQMEVWKIEQHLVELTSDKNICFEKMWMIHMYIQFYH